MIYYANGEVVNTSLILSCFKSKTMSVWQYRTLDKQNLLLPRGYQNCYHIVDAPNEDVYREEIWALTMRYTLRRGTDDL